MIHVLWPLLIAAASSAMIPGRRKLGRVDGRVLLLKRTDEFRDAARTTEKSSRRTRRLATRWASTPGAFHLPDWAGRTPGFR